MDVRDFVKKQESALRRYRRIYKLLDFAAITLILYILLFYLKIDLVFPLLSSFEVRAETSYDILGISITFGTAALIIIAAFFSLIITFILHLGDDRTKVLLLLENKHPELRERLRTAYDNANINNLIVSDLLDSVSSGIKKINSSSLLIKGKVIFGMILILVSSTTMVYVVQNDIRTDIITPEDIIDIINELPFVNGNEDLPDDLFEIDDPGNEERSPGNEDLTGETAVIVVEGKEVDLTLPPGTGSGFTNQEEADQADEDFDQSSPYEISIISSPTYNEKLPQGYESIIRSYFEEMAKK
ncbi:MAG: hypothetical protein QCH31_04905 [Methanolobus sp.]|nr:hypothetical protein [Methanolobus sp.]